MFKREEMIGKKYGKLDVIGVADRTANNKFRMWCICECGRITKVREDNLRSGHSKQCKQCQFDSMKGKKRKKRKVSVDVVER